jgi:inner membrane transporter RhtA
MMSLNPVMAAFAGFVVLDQRLGALQLVGIALVIVASAVTASGATPGDDL